MRLLFLFHVLSINTLALRESFKGEHAGKTIYSAYQSLEVPSSSYCN